jgi:hypothetical protein
MTSRAKGVQELDELDPGSNPIFYRILKFPATRPDRPILRRRLLSKQLEQCGDRRHTAIAENGQRALSRRNGQNLAMTACVGPSVSISAVGI